MSNLSLSAGFCFCFDSKAHPPTSAPLSGPGTRPGIRPVIRRPSGRSPRIVRPAVSCCLSAAGVRFLGALSCQTEFRPHYCRPTAPDAHTRTPTTDPGRVYTFPTRETRAGPGALFTPRTAVFIISHRYVRGRRLPPLNGRSLSPRYNYPTRDVRLTRHQQEFPGSRPVPALPLACDRHGWDSDPWAFPQAPHPTDQEPATRAAVGTGRTQTCSYVFDISRTSSDVLTHYVRLRVATSTTTRS